MIRKKEERPRRLVKSQPADCIALRAQHALEARRDRVVVLYEQDPGGLHKRGR